MGVFLARLMFLAFVGLTGVVVYNSLYLQDQGGAALPPARSAHAAAPIASSNTVAPAAAKLSAVTTDLPAMPGQEAPPQLVTAIQRELAARGYGSGKADGVLTLETRKAITDFEKDHGLPPTVKPSGALLRHILLGDADGGATTGAVSPAPSAAAAGVKPAAPANADATVQGVQRILADLGYDPGPVDGTMGTATEHAISAFQRDRKIAATGEITPELLREIKRVTGHALASETATR
jgi:peptidoglycan hydrolase-like protein with peptidoglycan-binding domain